MKDYRFEYDSEDDVLYIQNAIKDVEESVKISEDIIIDIDKKGKVIGIEIFYASEFLSLFNKELDKIFLDNLEEVSIEYKDFRNIWFIVLVLKSGNKVIYQSMPPLQKSEYINPLLTQN